MTEGLQTAQLHQVPPEFVRDFDYMNQPDCGADPHAAWARLHDGPDVFFSPRHGGYWVVTSGEAIKAVLDSPQEFSSAEVTIPRVSGALSLAPIQFDAPDHTRLKAVGISSFSPATIQAMAAEVEAWSHTLIDGFIDKGECEFVEDYALRFPIDIFMRLAGLPDADRQMLLGWMDDNLRSGDPVVMQAAYIGLTAYSEKILADRLENPGSDLVSTLIAEGHARGATREELLGYIQLMWFAGLDTVSSAMGFMARFLAMHPEHRRQLIDQPERIPNAVEEFLRRFGVSTPSRVVADDITFRGAAMRKGDMVLVPVTLYGLDPRIYPDPMTVDFARGDASKSLVFGSGIHRCLGAFLARLELRTFLRTWLARIPDFRIAPDKTITAKAAVINSLLTLPLEWDPAR